MAWLKYAFESTQPDVVYLFLCINDFFGHETQYGDAYYATQARLDESGLPIAFDMGALRVSDSNFYRLTLPGLRGLIARTLLALRNRHPSPTLTSEVIGELLATESAGMESLLARHVPDGRFAEYIREMVRLARPPAEWGPRTQVDVEMTLDFVKRMHGFLAGNDVKLIVSYAPFGWSVSPDETVPGKAFYGLAPDAMLPSDGLEARIRSFAERRGLPYMDLVEPLAAASLTSPQPLYFPKDGHWNVAGQQVVAAELLESLRSLPTPESK